MTTPQTGGELPRILKGAGRGGAVSLAAHVAQHGPLDLSHRSPEHLLAEIERSGLRGHGGAAFPTGRKMRTVAGRRGPKFVVVNATEGEPLSRKDRVLLREAPHLVLDGAAAAARAVGAAEAFVAFADGVRGTAEALAQALGERRRTRRLDPAFHLVRTPETFIAGQETALVRLIEGGPALPSFGARPYERGVRRRPTLVQNAETLAHVALIARHGAEWFRELGTEDDPGTALVTLAGALERPGVYEIAHGMALEDVLAVAGPTETVAATLIGGYFGSWISPADHPPLLLAPTELRVLGAALGAGVIYVMGASACPVREIAEIVDWLAGQSAGQCGPCVHGLAAVADALERIATGTADRTLMDDLRRWTGELPGRGACQHPDGAMRFVSSALSTFPSELAEHAHHGYCRRCQAEPLSSPLPARSPLALRG